jgi:tetratricopeptide (TPR) repeat protein
MATATALNQSENAQLMQTIEMFEVITQSQPQDYQSLEILKEAYSKLGREDEVVSTAKRIAQAYVQLGQLSSAILEYETILQRYPDDPDVQEALRQIEAKATSFAVEPTLPSAPETPARSSAPSATAAARKPAAERAAPGSVEDGRQAMFKVFVNSKIISAGDFDLCWRTPDMSGPPAGVIEPFIQLLADKAILPVDNSLKLLSDRTRLGYLPLEKYDPDLDLTRTFPGETCQRWCVLPFDRMSKSILVATANPFNQQAAKELAAATPHRLLWYLAPPVEIVKNLRKAFR